MNLNTQQECLFMESMTWLLKSLLEGFSLKGACICSTCGEQANWAS